MACSEIRSLEGQGQYILEGYIILVGNAMADFACEPVESLVEAPVGSGTVYNANKGVYWYELWLDENLRTHTIFTS